MSVYEDLHDRNTMKNLKTFLTNLSIWVAILLVLFSFYYVFKILI